jgi:hypothetical protein
LNHGVGDDISERCMEHHPLPTPQFGNRARKTVNFLQSYGMLLIFATLVSIFTSLYAATGIAQSLMAEAISSWTLPICFVLWVQADARSRRCTPCYDFGMFVLFTWLVSVPWYLIWTRGRRGLAVAFLFFGLLVAPSVTADLVWLLVNGLAPDAM